MLQEEAARSAQIDSGNLIAHKDGAPLWREHKPGVPTRGAIVRNGPDHVLVIVLQNPYFRKQPDLQKSPLEFMLSSEGDFFVSQKVCLSACRTFFMLDRQMSLYTDTN